MSAIVDYGFYQNIYKGTDATMASFPALCARAEDVVGAMTHWRVNADNIGALPTWMQGLYRKAVCAQIDALAINGMESVAVQGGAGGGFTVGKVTVQARATAETKAGSMAAAISPNALSYLGETGLLNPQVATAPEPSLVGWWF